MQIGSILRYKIHIQPSLTDVVLGHGDLYNLNVNGAFWDMDHLHVAWRTRTGGIKVAFPPGQFPFLCDIFSNTEDGALRII